MSEEFIPDASKLLLPCEINPTALAYYKNDEDVKLYHGDMYGETVRLYNKILNIKDDIMREYQDTLKKPILHLNIGQAAEDELSSILGSESELESIIEEDFIKNKQYFQTVPEHLISFAANNPDIFITIIVVSTNRYKYNDKPYILNEHLINLIDKRSIVSEFNTLDINEIAHNQYQIKFFKNEDENNNSVINVHLFNVCFPSITMLKFGTRVIGKQSAYDIEFVNNFYKNLENLFNVVYQCDGCVSCFSFAIYKNHEQRFYLNKYMLFRSILALFDKTSDFRYYAFLEYTDNDEENIEIYETNKFYYIENRKLYNELRMRNIKYRLLARWTDFDMDNHDMCIYKDEEMKPKNITSGPNNFFNLETDIHIELYKGRYVNIVTNRDESGNIIVHDDIPLPPPMPATPASIIRSSIPTIEDGYKNKYLKYKRKYLELKKVY